MYPNILLTRTIRRAIMAGLIAIFLFLAPTVILYSAGYRYDWPGKRLRATGVISVEITPADALVTINGVPVKKRSPFQLTNRAPGTYRLSISKEGYRTWEKEITVESKQTTYIKDVAILKDRLPVAVDWPRPTTTTNFSAPPDGHYLAMVLNEGQIETVTLFDMQTLRSTLLSRRAAIRPTRLIWSPDSRHLLLVSPPVNNSRLALISLSNPEAVTATTISTENGLVVQWPRTKAETVYVQNGEKIIALDEDGARSIRSVTTNSLWFVDGDNDIWLFNQTTNRLLPSRGREEVALRSSASEKIKEIIDINADRLIGRVGNSILVWRYKAANAPAQILPTTELTYNPNTKEWLTWSAFELWTIYEDGTTRLLNRVSNRIHAVYPLDHTGVLLIANDRGLTAFNPGYNVTQDLFVGRVEAAGVNAEERIIYFLGEVAARRGVYQLEY